MEIRVNIKQVGKRKNSVQEVRYQLASEPETVEELIRGVVEVCVREYNSRLEASELIRVMTKEELDARAETGKIGFGVNYGERRAETEPAVKNALQSFEDGIYRIFLNDRPLERLDEPLHILEEDRLTFVRLTMLAGRMW